MRSAICYLIVLSICLLSCKMRKDSNLNQYDYSDEDLEFVREVVPFNRLPISQLKSEESIFRQHNWPIPDRIEPIQTIGQTEYGIRRIEFDEIPTYIQPGDIAVEYSPIGSPLKASILNKLDISANAYNTEQKKEYMRAQGEYYLVMLAEQGMSHAKIITKVDESLCHLDAPYEMSGCDIGVDNTHFFRVEIDKNTRSKVAETAQSFFPANQTSPEPYAYDSFLFTDVFIKGVSSVRTQIEAALKKTGMQIPAMYCSELPLTLYSTQLNKLLFDSGYNILSLAQQVKALSSEPEFQLFVKDDELQNNFISYVNGASAVSETIRPFLTAGIKQLLKDGLTGNTLRYIAEKFLPKIVFPKNYMIAAKNPKSLPGMRIVYIGSVEHKARKVTAKYVSTQLRAVGSNTLRIISNKVKGWLGLEQEYLTPSQYIPSEVQNLDIEILEYPTDADVEDAFLNTPIPIEY